jgi:uncharacterized protein YeaO (DUF488 family)
MIRVKRVYSQANHGDGMRILVDRLWPRGISKTRARIHAWRKDLAPTTSLRKWFGHQPNRWLGFCRRYEAELRRSGLIEELRNLARASRRNTITLLYGAADEEHNQAVALKRLIEKSRAEKSMSNNFLDTQPRRWSHKHKFQDMVR